MPVKRPPLYPEISGYVDSHFHALQMSHKGLDPAACIEEAIAKGMIGGVEIGIDPEELPERLGLLPTTPSIFRSSGISPSGAGESWEDALLLLEDQLRDGSVDAVGEIGLDWYWDYGTRIRQIELFETQIGLANRFEVPIIIHNRDANKELVETIHKASPTKGGIMHCFSADWPTAAWCMDAGFHISFAGNLTYPSASLLREVLKQIPLDRLLLETDSPYLAPQAVRGKPNQPLNVAFIYGCAGEIMGRPSQEIADRVAENLKRVFSISDQE